MNMQFMDENLIVGYFQHKLTKEESQRFNTWLSENSENRMLFNAFKKVWSLSSEIKEMDDMEAENEFALFKYRYLQSNKIKQRFYDSMYFRFVKYAALFILAFALSFYWYKLNSKESVSLQSSYNEIKTKSGEKSQITLADGSKIWVNSCTSLKYPINLSSKHIDLYLDGEAYFDLKKIPNRNITVHTSRLNIDVLGTAFNLRSYADDDIIETTLVRGKIAITHSLGKNPINNQILLAPNQSAIYFKNTNSLVVNSLIEHRVHTIDTQERLQYLAIKSQSNLIVEESIDTKPQISWIEGNFIFRKETFEKLARRLERRYDVKINIISEQLKKSRFSGTFDKESIEQALKALSYPVPFNYTIIKDSVIIQPK
jgi:transmembrane sensor